MSRDADEQLPPDFDFDPGVTDEQEDVPDVIQLPDLSGQTANAENTNKRKGRHFGPRPVDDPAASVSFFV